MIWKINENNVIEFYNNNQVSFPQATEIFEKKPLELGLRFSTLLALNFLIRFESVDKLIYVNIYAIKGKNKIIVPKINNRFMDYIIIDNCCYYINPSINEVNTFINENSIEVNNNISIFDYVKLKNSFDINKLSYEDDIENVISEIKIDESKTKNKNFIGKLFPYQESGVKWLNYMVDGKCGCILADSMGLGKTLQIIMVLGHLKESVENSHSLVVCPITIMENWKREIEKFYPSLRCHVNYGGTNLTFYEELLEYDVIITSYSSIQSNFSTYEMVNWNLIVIDEAQNIKNPMAKRTKTLKELNKNIGIAVSGTPFENHITDVWSIVDFVLPGYLGDLKSFCSQYEDDRYSAKILEKKISPIMIRRKVEDVAKDLPERVDIPQPLIMTLDEAKYYDDGLKSLTDLQSVQLDKIQRLRMFCTHPSVYSNEYIDSDPITISQKYSRCCEIIEEIVSNNEKAIIFTSFNKMISLLVNDLHQRFNIYTDFINGDIDAKERQVIIDKFSSVEGSAVLVLNPKAAGAGLNITAANHVIHYNLEWNPAIEDQASARAYRRGQEKTVFIHRLFYVNTIEEIINEKIENKRLLSDEVIVGNDGSLNDEYLVRALTISPMKSKEAKK